MQEPLADGGVIRKLWIGEAARYRDHLLRLDSESRHSRFGGGVSDDFIRNYVDTTFGLGSVVHGFFADGVLRGAAELRPLGPRFRPRGRGRAEHRDRLAKPRHRLGAARPHAAGGPQPRHQDPAHGLPRQQPPDAGTGAQIRRRTELRFRRRRRRGCGGRGRRRCRCCGNSWPTTAALPPPCSTSSRRLLKNPLAGAKPALTELAGIGSYPPSCPGTREVPWEPWGSFTPPRFACLGPSAIEDYHAHLMRLDRASAVSRRRSRRSMPIASIWSPQARS